MRRDERFRGYWQATDNKCSGCIDVQEKKADKVDETQGMAIRVLRDKKGWTIVEGCGLAG